MTALASLTKDVTGGESKAIMLHCILQLGGSARSDENPHGTEDVFGSEIFMKGVAFFG